MSTDALSQTGAERSMRLTCLAAALEATRGDSQTTTMDIIDGYEWLTAPTNTLAAKTDPAIITHTPGDGFAAFAARRIILATMQRQREALSQVGTLDHLHAIAVEHSIVTPYSSMLVLVSPRQEDLLKQLTEQGDRFQREYEQVGETAPASPFAATGVSEPEEWLLIVVAAAMLFWYVRTLRRRASLNEDHVSAAIQNARPEMRRPSCRAQRVMWPAATATWKKSAWMQIQAAWITKIVPE